jgi:hypothetical protein
MNVRTAAVLGRKGGADVLLQLRAVCMLHTHGVDVQALAGLTQAESTPRGPSWREQAVAIIELNTDLQRMGPVLFLRQHRLDAVPQGINQVLIAHQIFLIHGVAETSAPQAPAL